MKFKRLFLSAVLVLSTVTMMAQPKVVAHRGYWRTDGSAQNSLTALRKSAEIGCYGSEFDVWMTADGVPVVFHDNTVDGIRLEDTTYATLMNHRLANGEYIPTLQQFLYEAVKYPDCQLIFELKAHRTAERENRAISLSLEILRQLGLEDRTEFISFSKNACMTIHQLAPTRPVAYLNGDLSPKEIQELGLTGIDYHMSVFEKHPEWVKQAHQAGLTVNVWTVDGQEALTHYATLEGIDYITTNDPVLLQGIMAGK